MEVGFKTDKGKMRANNEDAFFILKNIGVFIVADGVGGNNSGEIASRTAVTEIANFFQEVGPKHKDIRYMLNDSIKRANAKVNLMSSRYIENRGMATTVVVAVFSRGMLYIANVGDSRAYLIADGRIRQLTEDHTYVNELVKAGVLTSEEADCREDRNQITRAIGAESTVDPAIFKYRMHPGDCVLMCTDGLYGEVREEDILSKFSEGLPMSETCQDLVDRANENGGGDNITAVCIRLTEDDFRNE
ncbi:MAG: Stp1/IreP family PP2C-type Ser/Thr phosphatase [Eubacterium sp.]|jgi:serine/threonine protein phosphatase PrpC